MKVPNRYIASKRRPGLAFVHTLQLGLSVLTFTSLVGTALAATDSGLDSKTDNLQLAVKGVPGIILYAPAPTPATQPVVNFQWPIYANSATFTGSTVFNGPLTFTTAPSFAGGLSTSSLTLTDMNATVTLTPEIIKVLYNLATMAPCASNQALTLVAEGTFGCINVPAPSPPSSP